MGVPNVVLNVQDNGLAQNIPSAGNTLYVIGCASQGPFFQVAQSANPATFSANGSGPGVECAGFIANSTGIPVVFVPVPGSGATLGPVQSSQTNGSTSVLTITGTPLDTYYLKVSVLAAGTIGQVGPQIGISLDAGRTTAFTVNLPASVPATVTTGTAFTTATGLTLSFAAGSLAVGDFFTCLATEPVWTDAAVQSAINAILPYPSILPKDFIVAGGSAQRNGAGTVGSAPADVTAFDGYMTTLFNKKRFARLLCNAGDAQYGGASAETEQQWMNSLASVFASTSSLRVGVTAGHYNIISPYSQSQFRRPLLWVAAARDAQVAIQVDLGRVSDGSLANLTLPTSPDGYIYHDENVNPGLDAARFMTVRGFLNRPGLFITNPNLMAPPGSDFNWLQHGAVIDAACLIAYNYFLTALSSSVRVNSATGTILKQDALRLQNGCNAQLSIGLTSASAVSSATCVVSQSDAILTTATLTTTISIVPLGYLKTINVTITYVNPAIQQVVVAPVGP